METMNQELASTFNNLGATSKILASVRERAERVEFQCDVEDYFDVLMALERINDAIDRVGEIILRQKRKGAQKG